MALMLKTEVLIEDSVRHYANSILKNIAVIDEESAKLNYSYLNEVIKPFNEKMLGTHASLVALTEVIDKQSSQYVETSLIKSDAEIKENCLDLIKKIEVKKEKLKIFANKFDDLLVAIISLAKNDVGSFVKLSMDKKSESVAKLFHEPTRLFVIVSILKLTDFSGYTTAKEQLRIQAQRKYEYYESVQNTRKFLEYLRPQIEEITFDELESQVRAVCVTNVYLESFITGNLRKAHTLYWDAYMDRLEEDLKEVLQDL